MTMANRILVIDDSWAVLDAMRRALTAEGYEVHVATDLPTAARYVRSADLCIVDFHMPGLDGKSILVALKAAIDREHQCLFYLYTSDPEAARRGREYGFDGSFMKKGDSALLGYQVGAVFRTIRLSKLSGTKSASK
jgi:DNA-binding response OmpR family regulator